jgi:hypothetical protein
MKSASTAVLVAVAGLAFVLGQATRPSAAAAAHQPEGDEGMDAMMAAMAEAGTPGEHHRHLDLMLGTWEGTMKWTPAPGAPAMEFPGTATREWVLDGRYLREVVKSEGPEGMVFEGIGYTGYNNLDRRYETCWMDSMSTAMYPGHGTFNPQTRVFTFYSEMRDPATGRMVTSWGEMDMSDPDRHVMKGWCYAEDGTVFQNAEGVFERVR